MSMEVNPGLGVIYGVYIRNVVNSTGGMGSASNT